MTIARPFDMTLNTRLGSDPGFRAGLLSEAVDLLLAGDVRTGREILRSYILQTTGFPALSEATGIPAKSLIRMMGSQGNPRAENIFVILHQLQRLTGVQLSVRAAA